MFKVLILALLFGSCSIDLDFDQAEDFKLKPVFVANMAYFETKANEFIDNGAEHDIIFDAQDFDVFGDSFFRDNLVKTQFDFEVENTFYRSFVISLVFLDANNQVTHTTEITVPEYTNVSHVVNHTDVFESQKLALLKKSVRLQIKISILPGTPLVPNTPGSLKLRSGAILNFEIK